MNWICSDITSPLYTAAIDVKDGKILSSPYMNRSATDKEDKEIRVSGDKCFYAVKDRELIWTKECETARPSSYQAWIYEADPSGKFRLKSKEAGTCVKPVSRLVGSEVRLVPCTTDPNLLWSLL